ncbi:ABC transporter substrate-binding protein [Paenibacillus sp. LMG 31461]|uniref:ABC transporter substrate-binding protein n=1 Tax=Paenibacillus plantarum TaxID=2654975 RepID=A0ABX1X493_9BACL|nr:ABC transporter substrate-binding protein [Paenibacillus plantarum]NOU62840.1 ABC transporter substrate-binding protein [Paenibacillus plantarum]
MNKRKIYGTALSVVIAFTAGCSGNGETAQSTDNKSNSTVMITTARPLGGDTKFINGEDINNNIHNTWAKKTLGIEFKDLWNSADQTAYQTKLRLSLATQDKLPDVFIVQDTNLVADLIQSGKVKDIQKDLDTYASDRLKKLYTDNSSVLNQVKSDGKLMGLPILSAGDSTNPVLWVRQDWLDKLKLQAPTTIKEFEQVMDAFTKQDPDGNGKNDTIGFSFAARNGFSNWMSDSSFIFGAYTGKLIPGTWQLDKDGIMKYGSVQPGIKDGLGKLREWFAKGYLDPEVGAIDEMKATESFVQGKSGMIVAPYWANGWPLGDVKKSAPNALVRAYTLPTGEGGKTARYTGSLNEDRVMMFSKDFKNMDKFFLYMDKIYDNQFGTGEFKDGYFEGYDYAMVDGKPIYDPKKFPKPHDDVIDPVKYSMFWNTPKIPFKESKDFDYVYNGGQPETNAQKVIASGDKEAIRAGALNFKMKASNAPNEFLGAPTKTMRSNQDSLKTMELMTFIKIIYGEEPLDKFDTFVADWKSKGGDQIQKEVNDWYSSVKK